MREHHIVYGLVFHCYIPQHSRQEKLLLYALTQTRYLLLIPQFSISDVVQAAFDSIGKVYSIAEQHQAEKIDEQYQESGDVFVTLKVNVSDLEAFKSAMMNATSGNIEFTTVQ